MGLDIRFNTIGSKAFEPLCEWECEHYASIDLDMPRPMSKELVEIVTKAKELAPKIKAGDRSAEFKWGQFINRMNRTNGHIDVYFRKVPRLVPTTLYFIARAKGLSQDESLAFASAGNAMGISEDGWRSVFGDRISKDELYSGTMELGILKKLVTEFSRSSKKIGVADHFHGIDGFFWGNDNDVCDRDVWRELKKMETLIKIFDKESPGKMKKDKRGKILVEYSFSW